jgi:potassium-transporting ATPase potassium-binding subunit
MIVLIFIFVVFILQNYLPLSEGKGGLSIDLAFKTAVSYLTDTNLQHLVEDQQLSNFSQMIVISFAMFVAPASGIAAAFAIIRSFIRKNFGLGNFMWIYKDYSYTHSSSCNSSFNCIDGIGVPQTLNSHINTNMLENIVSKNNTATTALLGRPNKQ